MSGSDVEEGAKVLGKGLRQIAKTASSVVRKRAQKRKRRRLEERN